MPYRNPAAVQLDPEPEVATEPDDDLAPFEPVALPARRRRPFELVEGMSSQTQAVIVVACAVMLAMGILAALGVLAPSH